MKVFLDTNVLLDVISQREPFYRDSAELWTFTETGRITGHISMLSLPNLYFLVRRAQGDKAARKALRRLSDIFNLVPLDSQIVNQAIESDISDFEDGIQFFSALRAGATILVSRNVKDFPRQNMIIQTPTEFLAAHFPEP